jgi:hypothetical protein
MRHFAASIAGRIRLVRGRCPSCASEALSQAGCDICLGYAGPFPASAATQRRWSWRFEHRDATASAPRVAPPREISFPVSTHPLLR